MMFCLAALVVQGCSITSDPDPPLKMIWSGGFEVNNLFSTIPVGTVDSERFYTIRERAGEGRAFIAYRRDDGRQAWRETVQGPCTAITHDTRVYCPGDFLYGFDAKTGRRLWRYGDGTVAGSFQLVAGSADQSRVYVGRAGAGTGEGRALAIDAATGTLVWDRAFDGLGWKGNWMQSLTLSPEGDLLIAFTAEYNPPFVYSAAVIAAVDPATGEERWRFVDGDATTNRDIGELTFWEDLMMYTDYSGQEAVAVSRRTREVVWRAPFTPGSFSSRQPPFVAGGIAYYVDTLGGVFAVDARTGAKIWAVERPYGFLNHAVCGDIVYGDDQIGRVFDRRTGRYLGSLFADPGVLPGQVAVADDVLYISASSGVYAFDCKL